MSNRLLSYEESEAKVMIAIGNLLWIIPAIYLVQLFLAYSGITNVDWSGADMAKILIGVLWLMFAFRAFRFAEGELAKSRAHKIKLEELKLKQELKNMQS